MKLRRYLDREYLKGLLRRAAEVVLNPSLLICLGIAWMITNGWSYLFFALGLRFGIDWMRIAGASWMAVLWLPFTPEKILTVIIAIFLLRVLFPNDERTLGCLRAKKNALIATFKNRRSDGRKEAGE